MREVGEGVSLLGLLGEGRNGELGDVLAAAYVAIGNADLFGGAAKDGKAGLAAVRFADVVSIGAGIVGNGDW